MRRPSPSTQLGAAGSSALAALVTGGWMICPSPSRHLPGGTLVSCSGSGAAGAGGPMEAVAWSAGLDDGKASVTSRRSRSRVTARS